MSAAGYGRLECLSRTELHACRVRRQRQRDIAHNCHAGSAGFGGIGMACRGDLYGGRGRQICGRGIDACSRDRSDSRVPARNTIDAPTHACIRGVAHGSGERHLVAEHNRAGGRSHVHGDRRRRWWRRGSCASSAAAQCPCARREKSEESNSRLSRTLSVTLRKGPHALRRAGEGPAKKVRFYS